MRRYLTASAALLGFVVVACQDDPSVGSPPDASSDFVVDLRFDPAGFDRGAGDGDLEDAVGEGDASDVDEDAELAGDPLDPAQWPPELVGTWLVDQPAHALYEYTLYDFRADGRLVEGVSVPEPGSGGHPTPTGRVGRCEERHTDGACARWGDVTCLFGARWRSPRDGQVLVAGVCDDGQAREIELRVSGASLDRPAYPTVDVVSVGDEDDWEHNSWLWRFAICQGASFESCF